MEMGHDVWTPIQRGLKIDNVKASQSIHEEGEEGHSSAVLILLYTFSWESLAPEGTADLTQNTTRWSEGVEPGNSATLGLKLSQTLMASQRWGIEDALFTRSFVMGESTNYEIVVPCDTR